MASGMTARAAEGYSCQTQKQTVRNCFARPPYARCVRAARGLFKEHTQARSTSVKTDRTWSPPSSPTTEAAKG